MRMKIGHEGFIDHLLKIIAILLLIPIGLTGYLLLFSPLNRNRFDS